MVTRIAETQNFNTNHKKNIDKHIDSISNGRAVGPVYPKLRQSGISSSRETWRRVSGAIHDETPHADDLGKIRTCWNCCNPRGAADEAVEKTDGG